MEKICVHTQVLEAIFVFCTVWSVGSVVAQSSEAPDRDRFDALLKKLSGMGVIDGERVTPMQLPLKSLYEYCFDTADLCWKAWKSYVQGYEPPADGQFSKILVPTVDVVRSTWLLNTVRRRTGNTPRVFSRLVFSPLAVPCTAMAESVAAITRAWLL